MREREKRERKRARERERERERERGHNEKGYETTDLDTHLKKTTSITVTEEMMAILVVELREEYKPV